MGSAGHSDHGGESGHLARASKRYVYDVDQPAAILWYHDDRMDFTGPQFHRGLARFHLVTDGVEATLGCPAATATFP